MNEAPAAPAGEIVRARHYVSAPVGAYPPPVAPRPAAREELPAPPPPGPPSAAPSPEPAPPPVLPRGAEEEGVLLPPEDAAAAPGDTGRTGWGGLFLGLLVGGVVGSSLGMVLVAFFGGCAPSLAWTDPLAVWRTVTDPVIRFSGILVAAGFALLGAALGSRRNAPPPED